MNNFDLKKYLAESKLLKEVVDEEMEDYVSAMYNSDVDQEAEEGFQSDVWSKAEYASNAYNESSIFLELIDHLKSVGGKDVVEGNPDIHLELLSNGDIKWSADVTLDENLAEEEDFKNPILDKYLEIKKSIDNKTVFDYELSDFINDLDNTERKGLESDLGLERDELYEGVIKEELKAPSGWSEIKDLSDMHRSEEDDEIAVKAWDAPMEGWDEENKDIIVVRKEDDKFYLDGYIPFGSFDEQGPFDTYEEALKLAVEEMEAFKEDWDEQ